MPSPSRSVNPHEVVYALLENGTIAMANAHVVKFKIYGWSLTVLNSDVPIDPNPIPQASPFSTCHAGI
jgi:hypothetical protein